MGCKLRITQIFNDLRRKSDRKQFNSSDRFCHFQGRDAGHGCCRCGAVLPGQSGAANRRHAAWHRPGLCRRGHAGETVTNTVQRESCPCRRMNCPRHGDCAACREHHHVSGRKPLTRCEKLARKEQRKQGKLKRRSFDDGSPSRKRDPSYSPCRRQPVKIIDQSKPVSEDIE